MMVMIVIIIILVFIIIMVSDNCKFEIRAKLTTELHTYIHNIT